MRLMISLFAVSLGLSGSMAFAKTGVPEIYPVAGGLMVVMPDGSRIALDHGEAGEGDVRKTVTKLLGEPEDSGRLGECGAGPMDYLRIEQGLDLYFQGELLVGWFIPEGSSMTTFEGIGPGSRIKAVREIHPNITIEETTLGFEFWSDDLFGTVSGPSDEDSVEALWSGVSCIFR